MNGKVVIGAVAGILVGAIGMAVLSVAGIVGVASNSNVTFSVELSREQAKKVAEAIAAFDGKPIVLSKDGEDFSVQCPGNKPDACDLNLSFKKKASN